jgi:hypothetical protein
MSEQTKTQRKYERIAAEVLRKNPDATLDDIAAMCGVSKSRLCKLRRWGKIVIHTWRARGNRSADKKKS